MYSTGLEDETGGRKKQEINTKKDHSHNHISLAKLQRL